MPTQVFDTPEQIEVFRLCTLKAALKLEMMGMRHSRGPVAPLVRKALGTKTRDKGKLLQELVDFIEDCKNSEASSHEQSQEYFDRYIAGDR